MLHMTVTEYERTALLRMGTEISNGQPDVRLDMLRKVQDKKTLPADTFHGLMDIYRDWLVFGTIPTVEQLTPFCL